MRRLATLALLLVVASIARAAGPPPPGLGHDHPLTGRIWNVAQGRFVAMNALAAAVSAARFALLGERHDHPEHHEFQAWLLRRMLESGRRPAVAFEMLDTTQAPALARHLATSPHDAAGLGDAVGWRASGWPEWRLYQPIAEIALAAGLPVVAANLPATAARAAPRGCRSTTCGSPRAPTTRITARACASAHARRATVLARRIEPRRARGSRSPARAGARPRWAGRRAGASAPNRPAPSPPPCARLRTTFRARRRTGGRAAPPRRSASARDTRRPASAGSPPSRGAPPPAHARRSRVPGWPPSPPPRAAAGRRAGRRRG